MCIRDRCKLLSSEAEHDVRKEKKTFSEQWNTQPMSEQTENQQTKQTIPSIIGQTTEENIVSKLLMRKNANNCGVSVMLSNK